MQDPQGPDGAREAADEEAARPDGRTLPPEALTERTLYQLALCVDLDELREACGLRELVAPKGMPTSWPELVAAAMEGLERGWVAEVLMYREDGQTQLVWKPTDRGDRAIDAYVRRHWTKRRPEA